MGPVQPPGQQKAGKPIYEQQFRNAEDDECPLSHSRHQPKADDNKPRYKRCFMDGEDERQEEASAAEVP